jgi:hypothetical protein
MMSASRRRILSARSTAGDVVVGDFVRHIATGELGLLESLSGDCGLVINLAQPGHRDIVSLVHLLRAVQP